MFDISRYIYIIYVYDMNQYERGLDDRARVMRFLKPQFRSEMKWCVGGGSFQGLQRAKGNKSKNMRGREGEVAEQRNTDGKSVFK